MRFGLPLFGSAALFACAPSPPIATAYVSAPPAPAVTSVADAGAADAGAIASSEVPVDPKLGKFYPRVRATETQQDGDCSPRFTDLAALADGSAWVVGSCSERLLISGDKVTQHTAPRLANLTWPNVPCRATSYFTSIVASKPDDAWVTGLRHCGLGPDGVAPRALEHFDGKVWLAAPSEPFRKRGDSFAERLVLVPRDPPNAGLDVWTLAKGDEWSGLPDDGVFRHQSDGWGTTKRRARPVGDPAKQPVGTSYEVYLSMAVAPDRSIWVGGRIQRVGSEERHATVWRLDGKKWTEIPVDDAEVLDISIGDDGAVWIAGGGRLFRWNGERFVKVDLPDGTPHRLTVRSASDVWVVVWSKAVYHFDGTHFSRIPLELKSDYPAEEEAIVEQVESRGGHVWLRGRRVVLELRADLPPGPVVVAAPSAP